MVTLSLSFSQTPASFQSLSSISPCCGAQTASANTVNITRWAAGQYLIHSLTALLVHVSAQYWGSSVLSNTALKQHIKISKASICTVNRGSCEPPPPPPPPLGSRLVILGAILHVFDRCLIIQYEIKLVCWTCMSEHEQLIPNATFPQRLYLFTFIFDCSQDALHSR